MRGEGWREIVYFRGRKSEHDEELRHSVHWWVIQWVDRVPV